MKRFTLDKLGRSIATCALACVCGVALGETAVPPKLEPIEEPIASSAVPADEADVTVARRGGDRIEEFRYKGRLYMIKVYPAVGLPYMLVDDRGDGVFNRKDARGAPIKPAQWNVLSW